MTCHVRPLIASVLVLSAPIGGSAAQSAPAGDTVRLEVGSPAIKGRMYAPHKARVVVRMPNDSVVRSEWTNTLTLGDSAGRPVQRWVSAGVQRPQQGEPVNWEIYQNYDRETLAPYGYYFKTSRGAEVRLTIDGRRVRGTKRTSANGPVEEVDVTLPAPAFMQNASDLIPLAAGLREGTVMTAPMWHPQSNEFNVRVFVVLPQRDIDVEGKTWRAWPVEEREIDGERKLLATWYLVEDKPYMVAGEVPLPGGGVRRMTEVLVP
jgi:hypothetical protein